uniref:Tubulin, delta 1 n=1 Tax=Salmo trutta TaxID=8032 RepID=A0A674ENF1_SALTR
WLANVRRLACSVVKIGPKALATNQDDGPIAKHAHHTTNQVTRRYDTLCFHFFAWRYCVHGPRHEEVVVDIVRREVERYDRVAGGTGSGVGTYATQCLRDAYPNSFILNHLTWPYGTGKARELQLCSRCHTSDAILVHTVHNICTQLMNIKDISFSDINKVIAHQLGSVLQPALTGDFHGVYNRNPIGDGLVCHPEYKLLSFCNIPQVSSSSMAYSVFTWPGLLQHLHQMLTAFCMLLISHSKLNLESASNFSTKPPSLMLPNIPSNSQALLRPLDNMGWKAWNMFASRLGTSYKTTDSLQMFTTATTPYKCLLGSCLLANGPNQMY